MELRFPEPVHQHAFPRIPVAEALEIVGGLVEAPERERRRAGKEEGHLLSRLPSRCSRALLAVGECSDDTRPRSAAARA